MAKLIVYQGLPGSGKSTAAREHLKKDGNSIRINKDDLRIMLHGNLPWSSSREELTVEAQTTLVKQFLLLGKNVIVDDTNFSKKHLNRWEIIAKQGNHKFEIITMNTPIDECIRRDAKRTGKAKVGADVILNMAHRYGLKKQERPFVIYDLDGTLADITVRRKMADLGNGKIHWGIFFDPKNIDHDVVRDDVREMLWEDDESGMEIVIVSGRSDATREATEKWLYGNAIYYSRLIMRPSTDYRRDDDLKRWFLHNYLDKDRCVKVVDDRPQVIRMWKSEGMNVVDVGDGIEF